MLTFLICYSVFGLIIGSFLNVCIHRIPRRESVVFPGSHCPNCSRSIPPYDNVPLVSYLLLRGRCRFCGTGISLQYPAVELFCGLAFLACAFRWGPAVATLVNSLFISLIIVLFFIDYRHQLLPNVLTLPGTAAGILLSPYQEPIYYTDGLSLYLANLILPANPAKILPWEASILGALIGGGVLLIVASAYEALRKRQGLGMGDVKMMSFVGAFLGWRLALVTIFWGSLLGTLVGIFLVLFRGKNLQYKLAFGTFLGAGAVAALFFGPRFLEWYTAGR